MYEHKHVMLGLESVDLCHILYNNIPSVYTCIFIALSLLFHQLTNDSLEQTARSLSDLVQQSVISSVEQNIENLNAISNVLANVANYVNRSNAIITETVSDSDIRMSCCHISTTLLFR